MKLKSYPILRLAMFLAAGIFFAEKFALYPSLGGMNIALWGMIFLLVVLGIKVSYRWRWLFGVGTSFIMFLLGWILVVNEWERLKTDWPEEKQLYHAIVLDTPIEKKNSVQCKVEVKGVGVQLALFKDSLSSTVKVGDGLLLYTQIQSPRNQGNPYEFDYARYLYHHGISGTAYVYAGYWQKRDTAPRLALKQRALLLREHVITKFREWGISEQQLPVISALTLGCKKELDEETRDVFADAGISHVLALSGMHIGIVWLILSFLLKPVTKIRGGRWIKWLLSTVFLWGFAFVVGLEASVVRAVVMCMLMEMAKAAGAKPLSMNTLAIAATLMLFYNPFYLYDVGFQLSFVAVASIILFYPLLNNVLRLKSRLLRFVVSTLSVSIAAQLGAAPLVMYYFSDFSVYFLFANLIAAILVPFIIAGTFMMILVSPLPFILGWVTSLLMCLVDSLMVAARYISELPYATFSVVTMSELGIVLFYILLITLYLYGTKAKRRLLINAMSLFACLLAVHLYHVFPREKKAEIVFYNVRNCPAVHLIESDGTSYLISEEAEVALSTLRKLARNFWDKEHVKAPLPLSKERGDFRGLVQEDIIVWHGKRIGVFADNRWQDRAAEQTLRLDYIYLCKDFNLKIETLEPLFHGGIAIMDASLSRNKVERLKEECLELGIDLVDIASEGSLRIFL